MSNTHSVDTSTVSLKPSEVIELEKSLGVNLEKIVGQITIDNKQKGKEERITKNSSSLHKVTSNQHRAIPTPLGLAQITVNPPTNGFKYNTGAKQKASLVTISESN